MFRHVACAAIAMAAVADNQLFHFTEGNQRRVAAGKKPELLLDTGEFKETASATGSPPDFLLRMC